MRRLDCTIDWAARTEAVAANSPSLRVVAKCSSIFAAGDLTFDCTARASEDSAYAALHPPFCCKSSIRRCHDAASIGAMRRLARTCSVGPSVAGADAAGAVAGTRCMLCQHPCHGVVPSLFSDMQ